MAVYKNLFISLIFILSLGIISANFGYNIAEDSQGVTITINEAAGSGGADGNASSICSAGEVLMGDGYCISLNDTVDDRAVSGSFDGNASSICNPTGGDTFLLGNGSCMNVSDVQGVSGSGNTTAEIQAAVNTSIEYDFAANTSDFWDHMDSINTTQMEQSGSVLNILESWLTTFVDTWIGTKTTDDLPEGSTNLYDDTSWNKTYADTLYAGIGSIGNTTQEIQDAVNTTAEYEFGANTSDFWDNLSVPSDIAGSEFWYNHTLHTFTVYNDTWDNRASTGDNVTWNQSHADTLYADIQWGYNMSPTSAMLDALYACEEGKILERGGSVWECVDNAVGGDFSFTDFQASFDLNFTGSYDNESWNESYADTLYADISVVDTDTNTTGWIINMTVTDCPAGNYTYGIESNGSILCRDDLNTGAGGGNTTQEIQDAVNASVEYDFASNTSDFWDNLSVPSDIANSEFWYNHTLHTFTIYNDTWDNRATADTNETWRVLNMTAVDCAAGNYTYGIEANGSILCRDDLDTDTTYTAGGNLSLVGTVFDADMTEIKKFFDTIYQAIGTFFTGEEFQAAFDANVTAAVGDWNVNSSGYWDNLDSPTDITNAEYWYNHTLHTYTIYNDAWTSTYNATYAANVDSNETSRILNLTATDCAAGTLVIGVQANGTVLCAADADKGNPFDQTVNQSDSPVFNNLTVTHNLSIAGSILYYNGSDYIWD